MRFLVNIFFDTFFVNVKLVLKMSVKTIVKFNFLMFKFLQKSFMFQFIDY